MRILFIHNRYQQPGGEERAVLSECLLLQQKGHTAEILYFDTEQTNSISEKMKQAMRSVFNRRSYNITLQKINAFNPDIIHVHNLFFEASPSVLYAAKKKHIPVVATIHNYRLICSNALLIRNNSICELCVQKTFPLHGVYYKCYRSSALASATVTGITGIYKLLNNWKNNIHTYIFLTEFARKKIVHSSLRLFEQQGTVKPNFTNDRGMGEINRENFFLFAGRISSEKGVDFLLKAFSNMPGEQLYIAGDGPLKQLLQEQYRQFTNIHFKGRLENNDLIELMKKSKALLFPSLWYEGLPVTIAEAFSTGTPVLASKLGAMETMITDSYNGLHFNPGDAEDIKRTVKAFNHFTDKTILYKNARQTYLDFYTPEKHYESIMNIYSKLVWKKQTA